MPDAGYSLTELIDVARLQRLCDGLSAASGTVLAVLDPDGTVLVASGWQDICTRFHRRNETSVAGCLESDQRINPRLAEGATAPPHIAYKCANGLWDVAFPLVIDGRHVATVFTGQFFYDDETIDVEAFRARAAELGFEERAYLEALERVPILSHEQVEQTIHFLADLVGMLGELGLSALKHERDHAALQASEDQFRSLAEGLPVLVCATLADGTITYINEAAATVAGRAPAELIGRSLRGLVDEETRDLIDTTRRVLTAEHPMETHEECRPAADGSVRWYEWTNRGFFDDEGRLLRVQAIGRDVTERRGAEEALLESEQRLRLANKATNDVVWDMDIVNDSEHWVSTGETVFGWTDVMEGPVPDAWWSERLHPDDAARVRGTYGVVIDDPAATSWIEEYRFRRADGGYVEVLDRALVLRDAAGGARRVIGAMLDISERRRAEQKLQESREVLRAVLDAIPVRVFWKDEDLEYLGCNAAFAQDAGFDSPDDVVGKDDSAMGWREQADLYRADDRLVIESGEPTTRHRGAADHTVGRAAHSADEQGAPAGRTGRGDRRARVVHGHHRAQGGGGGTPPDSSAIRDLHQRNGGHGLPQGRPAALHHDEPGERRLLRAQRGGDRRPHGRGAHAGRRRRGLPRQRCSARSRAADWWSRRSGRATASTSRASSRSPSPTTARASAATCAT